VSVRSWRAAEEKEKKRAELVAKRAARDAEKVAKKEEEAEKKEEEAGEGEGEEEVDPNAWNEVGPARHCSPRHRMSFNSRHEGSKYCG
jgi:hypothetical protein